MNLYGKILRLFGWKILPPPAQQPPKSVICVAPHTSNWDFILGKLYYRAIGRKAGFLMKRSWFFFPLGCILRSSGGIPVDRGHKHNLVEKVSALYKNVKTLSIAITPEGTRKAREKWKTGFYRIALKAKVPIQLAYIDYRKKQLGVFEIFNPTGNMEADLRYIRSKYHSAQARHPKLFLEAEGSM